MANNKVQLANGDVLIDLTDTTATASDVFSGKYFYNASGEKIEGTANSGGTPSVTKHTIHFEFSDLTDIDINVYYDDTFVSNAITATKPTVYDSKTVDSASLDGVEWYHASSAIPIGEQLIDFSAVTNDYKIDSNGEMVVEQYYSCSDFTPVESGMTFEYRGCRWLYLGVYDENKMVLNTIYMYNDTTESPDNSNIGIGTLSGVELPANAKYVRITSVGYPDASKLSLIRTA